MKSGVTRSVCKFLTSSLELYLITSPLTTADPPYLSLPPICNLTFSSFPKYSLIEDENRVQSCLVLIRKNPCFRMELRAGSTSKPFSIIKLSSNERSLLVVTVGAMKSKNINLVSSSNDCNC